MTILKWKIYSHLTLTGAYAGQPICRGVKDSRVKHYPAVNPPVSVLTSPDTCPECLRLWNEAKDDNIPGDWPDDK